MHYAKITERLRAMGHDRWAVHKEGRRKCQAGERVIMLSIGEPDLSPNPMIFDIACRQMRNGRLHYANGRGEAIFLEALVAKYSAETGRMLKPDNFIFVPGTQTGLYVAAMTLLDLDDEVLVADPCYATYEGVIASSGAKMVSVKTDSHAGFHVKPRDLAQAITPKTKALLLNSPNNPTGAVLNAQEIQEIAALCAAHDLWIISDEIYADFVYGDAQFCSPFRLDEFHDRTIVVSSLSKSHAIPGFRCGWIAAGEEFCARALPIVEAITFGSQPFLQDAAAFALANNASEISSARQAYEARAKVVCDGLGKNPKLSVYMPEGGMFMMVDITKTGLSGTDFAQKLLDKENISTMPGESFGPSGAGHIRIALTVIVAEMAEACHNINRFVSRL